MLRPTDSVPRPLRPVAASAPDALAPSSPAPVAEMEKLTMRWGPKPVLDQVDLAIHPGERLVVVGPSGSGKSTILRLMAGLLLPTEGNLRIHGRPQTYLRLDQRHPPDVRMVFQNPALLASLNVRENVGFLLYRFSRLDERRSGSGSARRWRPLAFTASRTACRES
jgi:phospholipid/cholesterol/gamma-HCH transport system ATP-binding protein